MKLNKRQINKYISIFTDDEYIKMLKSKAKEEWFIEAKENFADNYYPYMIFTSGGYEDEIGFISYAEIVGITSKSEAKDLAISYQIWASNQSLSYSELCDYTQLFERLGKRYGLLKEFRENGIM